MWTRTRWMTLSALIALTAWACGDDGSANDSAYGGYDPGYEETPSTGVGQGGAQDFGLFRQILEAGQLPGPDALDAIGFFAEHKLDYGAADCGDEICLHPLLGIGQDFFYQEPFLMLQIGMNSPLKPNEVERPPLNLVLSIDTSGSMMGPSLTAVKRGLRRMLDSLRPEDKVSIVTYDNQARVLLEGATLADEGRILAAIEMLQASGATNIYDGLFSGYLVAEAQRAEGDETRVLLLSDGVITEGLTHPQRLQALAAAYAREGVGLTTIGVGVEFDVELMRRLGEVGAGNFYFLEDPTAVDEVFIQEIETFMLPVATHAHLEVKVDEGHLVRGAHGARGWENGVRSGGLDMPVLFLAGRQSSEEPIEEGRRGGGGGILVELSPVDEASTAPVEVEVSLTWTDPKTGEDHAQTQRVSGATSEGMYFTDETVEKGFVMLNLFIAFQRAAYYSQIGDLGAALGILEAVERHTQGWLDARDDADIEDDLVYVQMFQRNLKGAGIKTPIMVPTR